jgi:sugar phosphate isomerase/epimerase
MLLTLSANSLRKRLRPPGKGAGSSAGTQLDLVDLPRFAREQLGLYGLNLTTDLLAGADSKRLDSIREAADKASCPCLVLIETEPQPLADMDEDRGGAATERMMRVYRAAHRLGCNSVAVTILGDDSEDSMEAASDRCRRILQFGERMEINLLLASGKGLTEKPDTLTDLIKKIGGFRIGTFPDLLTASASPDPQLFLRRLTPYASAVTISTQTFKPGKKSGQLVQPGYDLESCLKVIQAVGYTGTLAIDYRGEEDPEVGIRQTKAAVEAVLGADVGAAEPDEFEDDLDLGEDTGDTDDGGGEADDEEDE